MKVPGRPQGATLWQRIRESLSDEIDAGRYPPGSKLPTEAQLSVRFGVNRHTVRRALEALKEEGRIHVRRGSGAYVTQGRFDYPIGLRTRLTRNLAEHGYAAGRRRLRLERVGADARDARHLEVEDGEQVVVIETVGEADGVPIVYARSAFPLGRLPRIEEALAEESSITQAFARAGITDYTRAWTRLIADRPGAIIARHLRMPENHPVLLAESVNVDGGERPVEYGRSWFCSDRVQLVVDRSTFEGPDPAEAA